MSNLTMKDKILVYLLKKNSIRKEILRKQFFSLDITQEGISQAMNTARGIVSRALNDLITHGMVEKKLATVKGVSRKLYIYYLTEQGIHMANEIKKITKIDFAEGSVYIRFIDEMPKTKYFFGREKEITAMENWLKRKYCLFFCLKGIAGIGKSSLLTNFTSRYMNQMHIFWYRVREWTTFHDTLISISEFLSRLNRTNLKNMLNAKKELKMTNVMECLKHDLDSVKALFIFDDFHNADDQIIKFFRFWKDLTEMLNSVKVILCGRWIKPFYGIVDKIIRKNVIEYTLSGLDYSSAVKLLKTRNIHENFDVFYNLTKGHPLCLELINRRGELVTNIVQYIQEEILSTLASNERDILVMASVFRRPFNEKAISMWTEKVCYEDIDRLIDKSLMVRVGDKLDTHELIKSLILRRIPDKMITDAHITAAKYYLAYIDEYSNDAYVEALYHYLSGKDYNKAYSLLMKKKDILMKDRYKEMIRKMSSEINEEIPNKIRRLLVS